MASTSNIRPERGAPSICTVTWALFQRMKTATVAHMKDALPPSAFDEALALRAIEPLIPAPAKLAK